MSLNKLTTKEIESKIDNFRDRISTLKEIIKDIKDQSAKATLEVHINDYKSSMDLLRIELAKRNK